ncbi:hypothetical protein [Flectobacillus roseus]|uniref:Uncharacterized protein n=1 Tax=Flectobacillus roseus TaxID=502259 RepID=A0ABT6YF72_9BACT|nr:hypothetical protein [Flectobacillus roseus]MDI9862252.1 hypothetical protein [Flectobacillus roseus]
MIPQFYSLSYSTDKSIIGYYPQTKNNTLSLLYDFSDEARMILRNDTGVNNPIEKFSITVNKRAKLTDVLDNTFLPSGLVISEKLKLLVENLSLPNHRFNEIDVKYENESYRYFWMRYYSDLSEYIDFRSSMFQYVDLEYKKLEDKLIISKEDCLKIVKQASHVRQLRPSQIRLKSNFPNYELFYDNMFHRNIVSNTFIEIIKKHDITGFVIHPLTDILL